MLRNDIDLVDETHLDTNQFHFVCRTSQLQYVLQDMTESDIPSDLCERINEEMRFEMVRTCKYPTPARRSLFFIIFVSYKPTGVPFQAAEK